MGAEAPPDAALVAQLASIVGRRHILTGTAAEPYARGYRFGHGPVVAAVRPGTLVELWRVAQACIAAGRIVIMQAANTGLTGGSTPDGAYDRGVVVVSTRRLAGIHLLRGGAQVVCLAGASLYDLERRLAPLGREPHSVIGSSCIGASVVGGVCNNSGGALVQRGPAYTEFALYGRVDSGGSLVLCNHLGIYLGENPEAILSNVEAGRFCESDVQVSDRVASAAADYCEMVRAVDEPTPARFNADPTRLFEASGSAGKLIVFAVRLDTFEKPVRETVFYIGTNDPGDLDLVRRGLLSASTPLPVSGEYIHRGAFDLADVYGKDMVIAISKFGTDRLPFLFRAKAWLDRFAARLRVLPEAFSDRLSQAAGSLFPDHLPKRIRAYRDRYEHHLILKVADEGIEATRTFLRSRFPSSHGEMFECSAKEATAAMLHRFAVAGAAVRYRSLYPELVEDIVALDVALPRNARDWFEQLPPEIDEQLAGKLYYGHFLCHVFHQDYLVRKGCDPVAVEHALLALLRNRGAQCPAEHNVGHMYAAPPMLVQHYRNLDPTNVLNPGIGKTSRCHGWRD